ncbi:hypothetical protein [Cryptosporangium minutisporangium]|uniref:Uncharacterized protein n=1 Tax=Cryptosporangium minutisporangium TaxID=113569 RepID=A0ABP6T614_9ACTN
MEDPTRHLTEPHPEASVSNGYVTATSWADSLSLTHWLNQSIEAMTGHNVLDELLEPFAGDWEAIATFGLALSNLARAMQDLGINVQQTTVRLDPSWDGNAADAAYRYFSGLAAETSGTQFPLDDAAVQYEDLSKGMWALLDTMTGLLKQLIDKALIAAIAAAAGTALLETVVAPVIGYGVAALQVIQMLELLNRCLVLATSANALIFGFIGLVTTTSNRVSGLKGVQLPAGGYQHPALS